MNNKNIETSAERYRTKLDTFYKDNSLEINSIRRTVYEFGKLTDNPYFSISQDLGQNSFCITMFDGKDVTNSIFENDKELKKFFEDMKTVANNPDKLLRFDFGSLKSGFIFSNKLGNKIALYNQGALKDKSSLIYIDKSEIDSMQSCYYRYKSEKTRN